MATVLERKKTPKKRAKRPTASSGRVLRILNDDRQVEIPPWVLDHASFRRWAKSQGFPEHVSISFINGELWVDMSMEKLVHNRAKTKTGSVLTELFDEEGVRYYIGDRML